MLPGDLGLVEVLRERLGDLGVPVVGGLPVVTAGPTSPGRSVGSRAWMDREAS